MTAGNNKWIYCQERQQVTRFRAWPAGAFLAAALAVWYRNEIRQWMARHWQRLYNETKQDDRERALVKHEGSCYCLAVKFSFTAPKSLIVESNLAGKIQFPRTPLYAKYFQLRQGQDFLCAYAATDASVYTFCKRCGAYLLHAPDPTSRKTIYVNVNCITSSTQLLLTTNSIVSQASKKKPIPAGPSPKQQHVDKTHRHKQRTSKKSAKRPHGNDHAVTAKELPSSRGAIQACGLETSTQPTAATLRQFLGKHVQASVETSSSSLNETKCVRPILVTKQQLNVIQPTETITIQSRHQSQRNPLAETSRQNVNPLQRATNHETVTPKHMDLAHFKVDCDGSTIEPIILSKKFRSGQPTRQLMDQNVPAMFSPLKHASDTKQTSDSTFVNTKRNYVVTPTSSAFTSKACAAADEKQVSLVSPTSGHGFVSKMTSQWSVRKKI